jgi:hypothetical protein
MAKKKEKKEEEVQEVPVVKKPGRPAKIPSLILKGNGWCEALKKSYFKGPYQPKNQSEYEALKKFAE